MPELLDSAGDPEAEDPETSASASTKDDEPAFNATEDSSSSSEAATEPEKAEPDNAKPDPSEPDEPEGEEPEGEEPEKEELTEAEEPEVDAEATSESANAADNAESLPSAVSGSIEPKQGAEDDDGPDLDGEVTDHDLIPGGEAEGHHKET